MATIWRRRFVRALMMLTVLAMPGIAGAGGPRVVRVRVPAKDLTRYFPPGTELRVLSPEEFEAAVGAAERASAGRQAIEPPRLIRARHRARLEGGLLRGRSELVVGGGPAGPFEFPMVPWTPAIRVEAGAAPAVGARADGAAVLRIAASPREQAIAIDWEQQPRPLSRGRGFALGLPAADTTVLELELPAGWSASSRRGIRRGPVATGDPAWSLWEVDGEAGRFDVELSDAADRGRTGPGSGAWLVAVTEVDLRRDADRAGSMVNWVADCRLELNPRHDGRLEAELDPGLELIDVRGEAVRGYRFDRPGDTSRVVVTIAEGVRSTSLRLLAHATVPSDGTWPIPAFRPLDAIWTGGRTTVRLDESHSVRGYRERAGRLVPAGRGDEAADDRLVFEAGSPRSVADLVLVRPRAGLACTVRGQLDLASTPARLDARLDWSLRRGTVSELVVDLSPGWSPDRVRIQGLEDPLAWHASPMPSGGIRLRAMLPSSVLAAGRWTLTVGATSASEAHRGPLELPRVHPRAAAVVDEAWLALGDGDSTIRPDRARGLAWIDPADVPGLATTAAPGLRPVLAWRWTAGAVGEPEARVERDRVDREPWASIRSRARLAADGRGLAIEGTLLVGAGGAPLVAIPIWLDGPGDPLASWHFRDEDGGELRPGRLGEADRVRLGLGRDASARALVVDLPPRARKAVSFRATLPWSSPGTIPMLRVPPGSIEPATIRVEVPAGMKTRLQAEGLGRLHPSTADDRPGVEPESGVVVHAFTCDEPTARLVLTAEPMEPEPMPGIVREAWLSTSWDGSGRTLNRLRMLVQPGQSTTIAVELPPGSTPVRARHDGAEVVPIRSGPWITMPAPTSGAGAARSSLFVVDYLVESPPVGDGSILRPDPPRVDRPCVSFTWEVSVPPGWRVLDPGGGLIADEPNDPSPWPMGSLGLPAPGWPIRSGKGLPDPSEGLAMLDGRLGRPPADDLTFAEWFSRWDAGPWPIVIDRLAMGAAGLGPRSPCTPGRLAADRRESSSAMLQAHGLSAIRFDGALLITTESERQRFDPRERWVAAIAEAVAWDSDRTDRFQSVGRWRGEVAPRSSAVSEPTTAASRTRPGREPRRFSSPGWPDVGASVHLVDAHRRALFGWIVAGLLAIGWLWTSRWASGRRLLVPAVGLAAILAIDRAVPARTDALTAGAMIGTLAILIVELARRSRRLDAPGPATARAEGSSIRAAAGPAVLLVMALAIGAQRSATAWDDSPIVALFPYEGTYDPAKPPDRVVLRLDDFRRLTRRAADPTPPPMAVTALSSGHRVTRQGAGEILVETEIELAARGGIGPFEWRVPVASAREITATIGGEPVSIAVEPGGATARIVLPGAGNYLLSLRRWAAARLDESGAEVLALPINSTPTARLIVAPPAVGVAQGVAVTRGRMESRPDRSLDGRLGPCDRLLVRWSPTGPALPARDPGSVDGLILWDVIPAGDRVRSRLSFHRAHEIASVRLEHDPGVVLRSARAAGRSRVYYEEEPGQDRWLLSFDPPMPPGGTLSVECWKPAPEPAPGVGAGADAGAGPPKDLTRRLPHIRPSGDERFVGVLGVRRPSDWTGRLAPGRDSDPIDDEAFVKAWGILPAEPLTLCGTARIGRGPDVSLRTGPAPPRIQVRQSVQLRIEAGRVVVAAVADIEAAEHAPILEAVLPPGLSVTQVQGDGLIDWTVTGGRRLHLTWRRRESRPRRSVRILGWIAIDDDPLAVPPRRPRLRTPWIDWPGAEVGPGMLAVFGPTRAEIGGGTGLLPAQAPPTAGAVPRLSYLVEDSGHLGELSWEPRPPQVSVTVESRLTLDPDLAHWVAAIRYDVLGGSLDRINLKIPAAWSPRARLSLPGQDDPGPAHIVGPSAFWSIAAPGPSLWGSHRLVLRSTLPLGSAREVNYPEVAPLGNGSVDTYLEVVNATGLPRVAEEATGLQSIARAGRFRGREFDRVAGTPGGAYWVVKKPWALRVQWPRGAPDSSADPDGDARAESVDVAMTVMPDRSAIGRALYHIRPGGGRLLTVGLPTGASILWAAVEPDPVVPMRAGPSSWSIPVDPDRPGQVCLIWRSPPPDPVANRDVRPLPLPRAGPEPVPALLSISAPAGLAIAANPPGLQAVPASRFASARAERLGQSIAGSLATIDRGSARDRERLVAKLIDHELTLRAADRASSREGDSPATPPGNNEQSDSIADARRTMAEAVRTAGLADELDPALDYLGLASDPARRPAGGIPEPVAPCRIRAFGRPTTLIGSLPALDDTQPGGAATIARSDRDRFSGVGLARAIAIAAALLVAAILGIPLGGRRPTTAAVVALALILAASAAAVGPLGLVGGLVLVALASLGRA